VFRLKAGRLFNKRLTHGLLILWACGLAPLLHIQNYSSHFGAENSYTLSILGQNNQALKLTLVFAEIYEHQQQAWPTHHLAWTQADFIYSGLVQISTLFGSSFYDHVLIVNATSLKTTWSSFGRVAAADWVGVSVDLPQPDKPPPFS
jgi:hypothetical protein